MIFLLTKSTFYFQCELSATQHVLEINEIFIIIARQKLVLSLAEIVLPVRN